MITIQEAATLVYPFKDDRTWLLLQPDLSTAWEQSTSAYWMVVLTNKLGILTEQQNLSIQLAMLEMPMGDYRLTHFVSGTYPTMMIALKRDKVSGKQVDPAYCDKIENLAVVFSNSMNNFRYIEHATNAAATFDSRYTILESGKAAVEYEVYRNQIVNKDQVWARVELWQADKVREIVNNPFVEK